MKSTKNTVNGIEVATHEDMDAEEFQMNRELVRIMVRTRNTHQAHRKAMDNRLGLKADGESQNVDRLPRRSFRPEDADRLRKYGNDAREQEEAIEKDTSKVLKRFPIWNDWLEHVGGIGPMAAASMIAYFDPYKANNPSQFFQYSGTNAGNVDGKKKVKKHKLDPEKHEVIREYRDEKGNVVEYLVKTGTPIKGDKPTKGFLLPYNKDLKTVMLGIVSGSLLAAGYRWVPCSEEEFDDLPAESRKRKTKKIDGVEHKNVPCRLDITTKYCRMYSKYKHRLEHRTDLVEEIPYKGAKPVMVEWRNAKPAHRDRAARRYMVKMFEIDLYVAWRTIHGLEVRTPYHDEKLDRPHHED